MASITMIKYHNVGYYHQSIGLGMGGGGGAAGGAVLQLPTSEKGRLSLPSLASPPSPNFVT